MKLGQMCCVHFLVTAFLKTITVSTNIIEHQHQHTTTITITTMITIQCHDLPKHTIDREKLFRFKVFGKLVQSARRHCSCVCAQNVFLCFFQLVTHKQQKECIKQKAKMAVCRYVPTTGNDSQ